MSNVKGVKLEETIFIKSDGNFHSRLQNMDNTEMENRKCKILIYSNSSAFLYINVFANFCGGHLEFV